jgi:hypothetical protein
MGGGRQWGEIVRQAGDIFDLYEANIDLLSPILVDELKDAEIYPQIWIEVFKIAVKQRPQMELHSGNLAAHGHCQAR